MNLAQMNLSKNAYRIVLYLMAAIKPGNLLYSFRQKTIAEELNLAPSNVCRAFQELYDNEILIKDSHGCVYFNANLAVCGLPSYASDEQKQSLKNATVETPNFPKSRS